MNAASSIAVCRSLADELARREERLARIAAAETAIEARSKERHAREKVVYDARRQDRRVGRQGSENGHEAA